MKNKYKYLITYCFNGTIGSAHLTIDRTIRSFVDIDGITERIKDMNKGKDVENLIIMNYTLVNKFERKRRFIK